MTLGGINSKKMWVGLNIPWFLGAYRNDIAENEWRGQEFFGASTDWMTRNFNLPGPTTTPAVVNHPEAITRDIYDCAGYVDCIRFWLFEGQEGLKFTNTAGTNLVTDYYANVTTNLIKILDACEKVGINLMITLFDANTGNVSNGGHTGDKGTAFLSYSTNTKDNLKNIIIEKNSFINNALIPIVSAIDDHPALWVIDIMNEPEGMLSWYGNWITTNQMRDFSNACASAIKGINSNIKVVTSFHDKSNAQSYSGTLTNHDFANVHKYDSDMSRIDSDLADLQTGYNSKPFVMTECGSSTSTNPVTPVDQKPLITDRYFYNIYNNAGGKGCMIWTWDFYDPANKRAMKNMLRKWKRVGRV